MTYQVKNTLIAALVASISLSAVPAFANTFKMAVEGDITDTTCAATVSKQALDMGIVNKNDFDSVGASVDGDEFTVTIQNCPAVMNTAAITIKGSPDKDNSDLFSLNQLNGSAEGVGVRVQARDNNDAVVSPGGVSNYTLSNGEASASFLVDLVSTKEVKAGSINSAISVEVTYQ
ncbi:fimbrial protein [Serratia sp. UGAL515B_01]|uniref:fimbrial protein n=1 Tax=Serratia sp. UGAL515B_01 TaxID=2986763 RepID=UPI002954EA54|nr:fimbrial protein [Serratia sp. UGAL515B_01]WON77762.1 fimbrial protein [Serratia sp. UGAL515B_01]